MTVIKQEKRLTQLADQPIIPVQEPAGYSATTIKLARTVSTIFHPFLVSPLTIVLILWLDQQNLAIAAAWALLCAAFVVLPGGLYLRRKLKQKAFSDGDVSIREQRFGYYLFGIVCMVVCFALLIWLNAPPVLIASFTAALLALVASALINRVWSKVSIHTGVMAAAACMVIFYSWPLALGLAGGTLLVAWARLILQRHTWQQTGLGSLIAIASVMVTFNAIF